MSFRITKQYARGPEIAFGERFKQLAEAQAFVNQRLMEEALMNVKVIYRIYDFDDFHSKYDSTEVDTSSIRSQASEGGKGNAASFKPTPLNTAPRPPGTPQKWLVDKDDEDKEKRK